MNRNDITTTPLFMQFVEISHETEMELA